MSINLIDKERKRNLDIYDNYSKGFVVLDKFEKKINTEKFNPLKELDYLQETIELLSNYRFYNLDNITSDLISNQLKNDFKDYTNLNINKQSKTIISITYNELQLIELDLNKKEIKIIFNYTKFKDNNLNKISSCNSNIESIEGIISRFNNALKNPLTKLPSKLKLKYLFNKKNTIKDLRLVIEKQEVQLQLNKDRIDGLKLEMDSVTDNKDNIEKIINDIESYILKNNKTFDIKTNI